MKILAIDSSTVSAGVSVCEDDTVLCDVFLNNGFTHGSSLAPQLQSALDIAKVTMSDIDCIAATSGPGSFTGLRIGAGLVKGLAYAVKKPIMAITTLTALAIGITNYDGLISPIIDARRGEVYNALYRYVGGVLTQVLPPRAVKLTDLIDELRNEKAIFVGDGVLKYENELAVTVTAPKRNALIRAQSVANAAYTLMGTELVSVTDAFGFAPFYLRASQAEQSLSSAKAAN